MTIPVRRAIAAAVWLALAMLDPSATAGHPSPGAHVGFWAGQTTVGCNNPDPSFCPRDLSAYTPAVWQALATSHATLYLDLVYTSDFGPGAARTDGLALVREANRRGVAVKAWLTAPLSHGTFANENNADFMDAAVKSYAVWRAVKRLRIDEVVLDLEFPTGYQAALDATDPTSLPADHGAVNPSHQCSALRSYAKTIAWAHRHHVMIGGSPVPFAIDDLHDGDTALADALDVAPLVPRGYDHLYVQAYRTYSDTGADYVAGYWKDMRHYFGEAGEVSLGDTSMGPPYTTLANLVADVRLLAALGATAIPVFDLDATVTSFGADGIRQVVSAGRRPLTRAEVAAATRASTTTTLTRGFFSALDTAATATSPGANSYPDGCR